MSAFGTKRTFRMWGFPVTPLKTQAFFAACRQTYGQPCNGAGKARRCAISGDRAPTHRPDPKTRMGEPGERLSVDSGPAPGNPLQCPVLSLGEGDETALQSRRRTSQIATPQSGDAKAAQCARVRGPGNGTRAAHPRARRGTAAGNRE